MHSDTIWNDLKLKISFKHANENDVSKACIVTVLETIRNRKKTFWKQCF